MIACKKPHNTHLSAPREQGIPRLKDNHARPIHGPKERNQGAEYVMCNLKGV